jgi:prepilin peptidase CpaA
MPDILMHNPANLAVAASMLIASIAVYFDVRERRIPNRLVGPAMVLGLVLNLVAFGPGGLLFSLTGLLLGGLLFLAPVALLGRGAGDLKLLAALGALCGPSVVLWTGLWAGVFGAVCALVALIWTRRTGAVLAGMAMDVSTGTFPIARSAIAIPYAVPIGLGLVTAILTR